MFQRDAAAAIRSPQPARHTAPPQPFAGHGDLPPDSEESNREDVGRLRM